MANKKLKYPSSQELEHEKAEVASLSNPWMKEGNRLRSKYHKDRDMQYLHTLRDEWEAKRSRV